MFQTFAIAFLPMALAAYFSPGTSRGLLTGSTVSGAVVTWHALSGILGMSMPSGGWLGYLLGGFKFFSLLMVPLVGMGFFCLCAFGGWVGSTLAVGASALTRALATGLGAGLVALLTAAMF